MMTVIVFWYDLTDLEQVQTQKNEGQEWCEREQQMHGFLASANSADDRHNAPTTEEDCQAAVAFLRAKGRKRAQRLREVVSAGRGKRDALALAGVTTNCRKADAATPSSGDLARGRTWNPQRSTGAGSKHHVLLTFESRDPLIGSLAPHGVLG